jgi:NAD(P)-dependent dehydrogenase (short-subunit alcohol dehydrogenase family)
MNSSAAVAIITGGASGIGAALARAMAERGDVVVIADLDGPAAEKFAAQLVESGFQATAQQVDVRDADRMQEIIDATRAQFGRIDSMVNNAGVVVKGGCEELTREQWDLAIDVNLRGVINGISAAYPVMLEQGSGHIVNVASLAGLLPTPLVAPYGTTKQAVIGLSMALRAEAAGRGVHVSVVCPSFVDTNMTNPAAGPVRKLFYNADRLAADVLHGVKANKGYIVAPRSARLMWRLQRTSPWLLEKIVVRFTARLRRGAPPMLPVRILTRFLASRSREDHAA